MRPNGMSTDSQDYTNNLFCRFDEAVAILFESDEAGEMVCGAMGDEDLSQTVAVLEGIRFNLLKGLR